MAAEPRHGDGEASRMTKCALVCGARGFIGGHLVKRLKNDGFWVRGVDLKFPEFPQTNADDFVVGDLRDQGVFPTDRDENESLLTTHSRAFMEKQPYS